MISGYFKTTQFETANFKVAFPKTEILGKLRFIKNNSKIPFQNDHYYDILDSSNR
jgi:hypothetical protein